MPQRYFCSETARPIEAKFHVEPPWDGGMKVFSNGPGYITNIATMPIYEGLDGGGGSGIL